MAEEFNLDVFPGDFGLPSLDQECLLTLAYIRFSGIPVTIHHRTNLYLSQVPALRTAENTIYGASAIIDYFERKNYGTDAEASQQKLDLWSYKTMITKKLEPCLQYFWWHDIDNYNQFIGGWYAQRLPFPTNFFIPNSMRKDAIVKLESQFTSKVIESEAKGKIIETQVVNDARYCLNLLIEKLADQSYLLGDKPTSLDAIAFTYLALLYKVPSKKMTIQTHISLSEPLKNYVDRILKAYFTGESSTSKSPFEMNNNKESESFSVIKWRDVVFSSAFAGVLMIYYAFSNGILNFDSSDDAYEADDEEPDEFTTGDDH